MAGGRPRVLDEGKQREVCALVSAGCSLETAAEFVNCAPNTIRREIERDASFGARYREAKLGAQLSPLRMMRQAAASHWRAAAWLLERTGPDQFARQPPPAFRAKQARTLVDGVLAILGAEIDNPPLLNRLRKQIRQLAQCSIHGVVDVERTHSQLHANRAEIDKLERGGPAQFEPVDSCDSVRQSDAPTTPQATVGPTLPSGVLETSGPAQTQ